jgi:hypothetical protein
MRRFVIGAFATVVISGCAPSMIARDYARFSGCDEKKVEVRKLGETQLDSDKYRASGCGPGAIFYCSLSGCKSPQITIAQRHARQFGCSTGQVNVEYLDGGAWKASGCDHDLTYQCVESDELVLRCIAETADEDRKHGDLN